MLAEVVVPACGCVACQTGDHPHREDHRQLKVLLSRLDEQQRRWVAGREAARLGHGGIQQIAEITGLHPETIWRGHHAQRDQQFRHIAQQREEFRRTGNPRVSVDTKKKELVGEFQNDGQIWRQEAERVNDHDFPSDAAGTPAGIPVAQRPMASPIRSATRDMSV